MTGERGKYTQFQQNKWIFNWNTKKEAVNKNDFSFFHSPLVRVVDYIRQHAL
jgi:hypothetical protein